MSTQKVPFFRWMPEDEAAIAAAISDVIKSRWLIVGPKTEQFESEIARLTGRAYCVATSSCTTALYLALRALDIRPHTAVAVPTITWPGTVNSIVAAGLRPDFRDVGEDLNIRWGSGSQPQVAVPVALYGRAVGAGAAMTIVDAAHALDGDYITGNIKRPAASIGLGAVLSFYVTKAITTGGEGGAFVTDDDVLARRVRNMRDNGVGASVYRRSGEPYALAEIGLKATMTEMQAAVGLVELAHLTSRLEARRRHVSTYLHYLEGCSVQRIVTHEIGHACHLFPILVSGGTRQRDAVRSCLRAAGIETGLHYRPVHTEAPYTAKFDRVCLLAAENYGSRLLSLPLYPSMTEEQIEYVASTVKVVVASM